MQDEQAITGDWLDRILNSALSQQASDIHIEPNAEKVLIRFRVDGALRYFEELPFDVLNNLASRLKVLSQLDITNQRLPQDGHIQYTSSGKTYSMRLSTIPTQYGETIVLRILSREDMIVSLETIGLELEQIDMIKKIVMNPNGLLLVTGPTGSGKSTLLYSLLQVLNTKDRSVVTLEDPIEVTIQHINQSQINEKVGLNYAILLRALLRQDPDTIMVGEIRDQETLQVTMQAALSGVFVLSTFHSFDIPALVVRLTELGIGRSVVAQALRCVISTRLLRKICKNCQQPYQINEIEKSFLGAYADGHQFYRGYGCDMCNHSGYRGRVGVFEIVPFDYQIKAFVIDNKSLSEFYAMLKAKQVKSLKDAAIAKAVQGITTIDEVIRKVGFEFNQ